MQEHSSATDELNNAVNAVISLFRQSRTVEAEAGARELVRIYPKHPFGWKALGMLYAEQGRLIEAEQNLHQSLMFAPQEADVHDALGSVLGRLARPIEAIECYRNAIKCVPNYPEAHNNLANTLKNVGEHEAAIKSYELAIKCRPEYAEAYFNLGLHYQENLRNLDEAIIHYQKAIHIKPDFADAHYNLAATYKEAGRLDQAIASYHRALECRPNDADAHYNLGNTLKENHQLTAAITSFQCAIDAQPDYAIAYSLMGRCYHELGDPNLSMQAYQRALEIDPSHADTHNQLGLLFHDVAYYHEAIASYTRALAIKADIAEVWNNMGNALNELGSVDEAAANFECAITLNPSMVEAYSNLGTIFRDKGLFDDAIAIFLRSLEINPQYEGSFDNLLFTVNYHPDLSGEDVYKYYRAYDEHFGQPLQSEWSAHLNDRNPDRRLKIGYVSPSLHRHSVRHFLEPLLAHHKKEAFEVYAYAQITSDDEVTCRYQVYVDHWVNTRGMSDEQLAARVRQDHIDILIDIAGHTGHNRLLVFARKPAPVSLHWLDFGYTTGLTAIDYYLTDAPTVPEGSEHLFSETPWRLPVPAYVYRPDNSMGEVTSLPAVQNGFITFGTLTRSVRINHRVIKAWVAILEALPNARLLINSGNFKDPAMQEHMAEYFTSQGISRDRLEIGYESPAWKVLQRIDISLDCFPHNSGTTLFESLYMGVPFITLANRPSVGTLGVSVLHGLGHPEWSAESESEYVEKAIKLAQNIEALAQYRENLRDEMKQSPLMDEKGFAMAVEQAYRQMWHKWCANAS